MGKHAGYSSHRPHTLQKYFLNKTVKTPKRDLVLLQKDISKLETNNANE
jgi:hypothetical protein